VKGEIMRTAEVIEQNQIITERKFQFNLVAKFAIFEAIILLISLATLALIFTKLNSVALPVSIDNGRVISFEATQSMKMADLLWPVTMIAISASIIGSFAYTKLFGK
jgi:hypothetical protein